MSLLQSAYQADFYPRPPRGGRRLSDRTKPTKKEFLSTPSARRATFWASARVGQTVISIHALREEGDPYLPPSSLMHCAISIHALREEGDANSKYKVLGDMQISIHALREEGDTVFRAASMRGLDFYPRPPRGGRLAERSGIDFEVVFLSTPSARRATQEAPELVCNLEISIHALREEGDRKMRKARRRSSISIHALREEGDPMMMTSRSEKGISIHALREEGDPAPRLHRSA